MSSADNLTYNSSKAQPRKTNEREVIKLQHVILSSGALHCKESFLNAKRRK